MVQPGIRSTTGRPSNGSVETVETVDKPQAFTLIGQREENTPVGQARVIDAEGGELRNGAEDPGFHASLILTTGGAARRPYDAVPGDDDPEAA